MRQVFTSQRLENVEGVARLLNEQGIETWISQGRSYKGERRRGFSYRTAPGSQPQPALWVVHKHDLVQARRLLREGGLIETTRPDGHTADSFLPSAAPTPTPVQADPERRRRMLTQRIRIGLLILTVILIGVGLYQVLG